VSGWGTHPTRKTGPVSIQFGSHLPTRRGLATDAEEAVFWSGISGGDATAAAWVGKHRGTTLETTLAQRGVRLPPWDPNDPAVITAWRNASADFAAGARGPRAPSRFRSGQVRLGRSGVSHSSGQPECGFDHCPGSGTGAEVLLWSR
jgi:filamentous hemagglutinin